MSAGVLPDLLVPGLRVVFCGTAPSTASARARAYYANPGNRFWRALHEAGLTPRQLAPSEFTELPRSGIGLTDVSKTAYGVDREIEAGAYDPDGLTRKIALFAPGMLAFTSKRAACVALGLQNTAGVSYGQQDARVGGAPIWVLPSPSGAAVRWWDLEPWRALRRALPATG